MKKIYILGISGTQGEFNPKEAYNSLSKAKKSLKNKDFIYKTSFYTIKEVYLY